MNYFSITTGSRDLANTNLYSIIDTVKLHDVDTSVGYLRSMLNLEVDRISVSVPNVQNSAVSAESSRTTFGTVSVSAGCGLYIQ